MYQLILHPISVLQGHVETTAKMTGFAVSESAVWPTVRRPLLVILNSIWTSTAPKNLVVQSLTALKLWMCVRKDSTCMRCLNPAHGNTMHWIWLIAATIFFHHLDPNYFDTSMKIPRHCFPWAFCKHFFYFHAIFTWIWTTKPMTSVQ